MNKVKKESKKKRKNKSIYRILLLIIIFIILLIIIILEFRVYNRTVSNDEVSYLSNKSIQTQPSLSLFNIEVDNIIIFYCIVLLIILAIVFLIFYILARLYGL